MKSITGGLVFGLVALLTGCQGLRASGPQGSGSISQVKHIVWMLQENRSFDNYFGKLNDYRQAHGLSAEVDGIPTNASNPSADGTTQVQAFHLNTACIENVTPSWDESRIDVNHSNPEMKTGPMDGFVFSAAHYAVDENLAGRGPYADTAGIRAMGYYTERELPYYYFMATQFATSDRFFSPILSRTPPNRIANFAASALGIVNDIPAGASFQQLTIFHLLQATGTTWKIYETSGNTYLGFFGTFFADNQAAHIAPISEYFTDVTNGTLPAVAFIETGVSKSETGGTSSLDEHPDTDIQTGAAFVERIVNALMQSTSWSSSVFMLAYDEAGGVYDHVPPQPAVIPDAIPPQLGPNNIVDDYSRTGMRIPLLVISPFTKKGFVSHTVMDSTAILKFIETRFGLPSLTARDAAQPDMTEFFDFTGVPNLIPPTPPPQTGNAPCTIHTLP